MTISRPDSPSPSETAAAAATAQHAAESSTPGAGPFSARSSEEGAPVGADAIELMEHEVARSSQKLLEKLSKLKNRAGSVIAASSLSRRSSVSSRSSIRSLFSRQPKTAEAGTQTDEFPIHSRRAVDYQTLVHAQGLSPGGFDNDIKIRTAQDNAMAARFADNSAVLLPDALKETVLPGYICNPGDFRLFVHPETGEIAASLLKTNTSGWGNILAAPDHTLTHIEQTYARLGNRLHGITSPLVLIGSSGRAQFVIDGDPTSGLKDNQTAGEKLWAADNIAQPLREMRGAENVDVREFNPLTFGQKARESNFANNGRPTILVGYTQQFNEDARMRVNDGVLYFNGRKVDCIVNERFVANIEKKHGPLDRSKIIVGPMVNVGTDKSLSYQATNKFNQNIVGRDKYPMCERYIPSITCNNPDEMIKAIRDLFAEGKSAIIKPRNTGWGDGITAFKNPRESDASIRQKIQKSVAHVDARYNQKGVVSGFPYTVTEYLVGSKIVVPKDPKFDKYRSLEGYSGELRIGAYPRLTPNGGVEVVGTVACIKLQHPASDVANTSAQKATLGVSSEELMLPGCNAEVIELLGLTEGKVGQVTNWFAGYMSSVLIDLHNEHVQVYGDTVDNDDTVGKGKGKQKDLS